MQVKFRSIAIELRTRHQLVKLDNQLAEITTRTATNVVVNQEMVNLKKKKLKVRQDVAVETKVQIRKVPRQTIKPKKS